MARDFVHFLYWVVELSLTHISRAGSKFTSSCDRQHFQGGVSSIECRKRDVGKKEEAQAVKLDHALVYSRGSYRTPKWVLIFINGVLKGAYNISAVAHQGHVKVCITSCNCLEIKTILATVSNAYHSDWIGSRDLGKSQISDNTVEVDGEVAAALTQVIELQQLIQENLWAVTWMLEMPTFLLHLGPSNNRKVALPKYLILRCKTVLLASPCPPKR